MKNDSNLTKFLLEKWPRGATNPEKRQSHHSNDAAAETCCRHVWLRLAHHFDAPPLAILRWAWRPDRWCWWKWMHHAYSRHEWVRFHPVLQAAYEVRFLEIKMRVLTEISNAGARYGRLNLKLLHTLTEALVATMPLSPHTDEPCPTWLLLSSINPRPLSDASKLSALSPIGRTEGDLTIILIILPSYSLIAQ